MKNLYDINESKIKIEGKAWDDDELLALSAKKTLQFTKCCDYWRPLLERGRTYMDRYNGKILTDNQRKIYEETEDKIVVEPPIAKAYIRALVGSALQSRKSGQVVTERSAASSMEDNSRELEVMTAVLKDIELNTNEGYRIKEAFKTSLISCWWNVILFSLERPSRNKDALRYKMVNLPWSSCVFGPATVREPNGEDIRELFYFDYRTKADLIDNFPDMEKQIIEHFGDKDHVDSRLLSSISQWEDGLTADERDTMFDIGEHAAEAKRGASGLVKVISHLFPIKRTEEVWVDIFDDSGEVFEIRPPDWDDARWERWVNENRDRYVGPYEREVITLWQTIWTTSGLVLANEKHFFQENGMLPCSFWLGDVDNGKPTGPLADMSDDVLANAVAEIERLDDLRKGSGRLLLAREGSITNMENLATEANKAFGLATISKDFNGSIGDAVQEMVRTPNTAWRDYAKERRGSMIENTRITEAMLGSHAPRQSAIAKESEISQSLTVNASLIDNLNRSWNAHQNLKLKLVPYFYTEHETLEVMDEKTGNKMTVEVNVPAEYDMEGNVSRVINDLAAHRYRWKVSPVDDSPTAKQRHMEDALAFVNSGFGPMFQADPSGMSLTSLLAAFDNPFLREMGNNMQEQAQSAQQAKSAREELKDNVEMTAKLAKAEAELLRAQKNGVILNGRFQDFADFPALGEIYGMIQQQAEMAAAEKMDKIQQSIMPSQPQEGV